MTDIDSSARPVRDGVPEHGRIPRYFEARARLLALVGELGEGAPLPSERELAERFGVARNTLRQAISELVLQGRLRAWRGRGTFVAPPKLIQPLGLRSYTEAVRSMGRTPGRRLIGLAEQRPEPDLAALLALGTGERVLHLERVLLADDEPVGLESTYLPAARFGALVHDFDPETSLYRYLQERRGVTFASAAETIETVLAAPREASLLGTNPALPMLLVLRTSYEPDGTPIERVRSLFRGDRMGFSTRY